MLTTEEIISPCFCDADERVLCAPCVMATYRQAKAEAFEIAAAVCDDLVNCTRAEFGKLAVPDTLSVHNGNCAVAAERIRALIPDGPEL